MDIEPRGNPGLSFGEKGLDKVKKWDYHQTNIENR
jgi:hypothetical protein